MSKGVYPRTPAVERFLKHVEKTDGCWIWTADKKKDTGYGRFWFEGRKVQAHRFSYATFVGPIPDGMDVHHTCVNPPCVNPTHLEPRTPRDNTFASDTTAAVNARKTHCPRGHEYDDTNTYRSRSGKRNCKACVAASMRRFRSKERAA